MKFVNVVLISLALVPFAAPAQDAKEAPGKKAETKQAKPAAKAPDQAAMMKAWQESATPGEAHKKLEPMIGSWTAKVKSWMAPGAPPQESDGTAEFAWIMGNRFVEEKFKGMAMGQPFEGEGWSGYDNNKKKYVGTWIDNMGTAVMMMTGSYDKTGKVMTSFGTMDDPMTKKATKVKSVATMPDADHMLYEMYTPGPDGKMVKNLEITYTRTK